jgi:hypothetical protein
MIFPTASFGDSYVIPQSSAQEVNTAVMPGGPESGYVYTVVRVLLILATLTVISIPHFFDVYYYADTVGFLCYRDIIRVTVSVTSWHLRNSRLCVSRKQFLTLTRDLWYRKKSKRNVHSSSCHQDLEFVRCELREINSARHFLLVLQSQKGRLCNCGGPGAIKEWSFQTVKTNLCYDNSNFCLYSLF